MKELLKRQYVFETKNTTEWLTGYFKPEGQMSNGQLSYSRCDKNGNILEENAYIQCRTLSGHLRMYHI